MAYGQTGTGKTFTLGHLGDDDTSARGIMVRAMEDILADISPETDSVSVSYLQVILKLTSKHHHTYFNLKSAIATHSHIHTPETANLLVLNKYL